MHHFIIFSFHILMISCSILFLCFLLWPFPITYKVTTADDSNRVNLFMSIGSLPINTLLLGYSSTDDKSLWFQTFNWYSSLLNFMQIISFIPKRILYSASTLASLVLHCISTLLCISLCFICIESLVLHALFICFCSWHHRLAKLLMPLKIFVNINSSWSIHTNSWLSNATRQLLLHSSFVCTLICNWFKMQQTRLFIHALQLREINIQQFFLHN